MCASKTAQLSDAVLPDLCISGNFICPCTDDQRFRSFPNVHKPAPISVSDLI